MDAPTQRHGFTRIAWPAFVGTCLAGWCALLAWQNGWADAAAHWPMALVMAVGSLVAGSMPMGGGAVAFPALVLGYRELPSLARDFGLAIQSVGLVSAFLFIVSRGIPIERALLAWSGVGSVAGLALGTVLLAGRVPADVVKLAFSTLWVSFAIWLVSLPAAGNGDARPPLQPAQARAMGVVAGVVGGVLASLIGVGVEMTIYAALVIGGGWGPRSAIPTAVCAMAVASPVGLALRASTAGLEPHMWPYWTASLPIALVGAPTGAWLSPRIPRRVLLNGIGILALAQFALTIAQVRAAAALAAGTVLLALGGAAALRLCSPREEAGPEVACVTRKGGSA